MSFTVYKSSAGSGKTFTLVKEYLKIALADPQYPPQDYRRILAITFTNKAAAEMKDRIIRALKQLSLKPSRESHLQLMLHKETGLSPEIISQRATAVLESILHNYTDFAVGTIDSFVHRILRTFAFDLKIPFAFDVEVDNERLLGMAIDQLISRIGTDETLTRMLLEFAEGKVRDEKSWHIENELKKIAETLLREDGINYIQKLKKFGLEDFTKTRAAVNKVVFSFESEIIKQAGDAMKLMGDAGLSVQDFSYGNSGIAAWFRRLSEGNLKDVLPKTRVQETVRDDKWAGSKVNDSVKNSVCAIKDQLSQRYHAIQDVCDKQYAEYSLFILLRKNLYALAVLNEIEKIMEDIKAKGNILHISEFNKIISKIVTTQPVPFIYERLGEKYANYLLDEFQDTSVLQFHNLLPLIDNSLSQDHFTMIVGDGKQAIYRWRGGEVEQFSGLPKVYGEKDSPFIEEREASLVRNYNPQHLTRNFRSRCELVHFNNHFFSLLSENLEEMQKQVYHGHEQQVDELNTGGYVQLRLLEKGEGYELHCMNQSLEIIRSLKGDGYNYSGITLLVRKNKEGNALAEFLSGNKIPVISAEALLLKTSGRVNLLISMLEFLRKPGDAIARSVIARHLVQSGRIPHTFHDTIVRAAGSSRNFFNAFESSGIKLDRPMLLKLPLYDLCSELAALLKLNPDEDAYVLFFMETILSFTNKNEDNLDDFLEWWNEERTQPSVKTPEGTDAVTIMSIHRSKGLEFPVVILPFAGWKTNQPNELAWVNLENKNLPHLPVAILPINQSLENTEFASLYRREKSKCLLDNLNLLYVAFTRPRERLFILSPVPSTDPSGFNNTADMIGYFLGRSGLQQPGKNMYEFGKMSAPAEPEKREVETYPAPFTEHADWRNILRLRKVIVQAQEKDTMAIKRNYGILLHEVLSRIHSISDSGPVLEGFFTEGLLSGEEKTQIGIQLDELFRKGSIKELFSVPGMVKTEAEILLPDGSVFRPDRVVLDGNKGLLIDFKTGEKSATHKKQLKQYARALGQMGINDIKTCILYTRTAEIEYVD